MQVAEEVRAWLARRRISGAELARRIGRSQTFVAKRLDGRQAFDIDDLEMVANVLGIAPEQLITSASRAHGGVVTGTYTPG
jgi:transcriptional regulator with XRE-family HTH domain